MKERIGVYICHCGGNISDYVDVEEISKMIQSEGGVVIGKDVMFACADSNQKEMIQDIHENKLDAIVVASCSPKLHLHTFRNVAIRAGLNPFNYVQVNIREQCSWPHSDNPKEATHKAIGLIRAGIKKVAESSSLENIEITATKAVLVLGGGVAGMRAAIELAKLGNEVYIVEQDYFVGGKVAQANKLFMTEQTGQEVISRLYNEIKSLKNITLFTGASVEKSSGSVGNFDVDVLIRPRYIVKNYDSSLMEKAIAECPVELPDPFNFGLTKRKAIYKNSSTSFPDIPVVDIEALKNETAFLEKYKSCIDSNQQIEKLKLKVGAVLVTTGFDNYQPKDDEYGYNTIENVITLPEFKRVIEHSDKKLTYKNKEIKKVAFVYCVGNRQYKGENKYCSRFCCTSAIHTSLQLNEKFEGTKAYHLFRDIRTYGKQEILYEKSSRLGDIYIRFDEKEPPKIERQDNKTIIKVKDYLTSKKELEFEADLVVLVTGMVSHHDSNDVAAKLKIPIGRDKFFNEIHPKLKPVETVIKGVYIGGSCQGPKNITESVQSSLSGAAKINALITTGKISLDPIIAKVNPDACVYCGKCAEVCEYDAISEIPYLDKKIAEVNKGTCKGCGICAPICPTDAIEIAQNTNKEMEAMIDGFMEKIDISEIQSSEKKTEEKQSAEMKEFPQIWKNISELIKEEPRTIPQLTKELGISSEIVTYNLMTMNKYGVVVSSGIDENDAYFFYKMKN